MVARWWTGYPNTHPRPPDIFLLIEVADSSLVADSGAKVAIYANSGIREYWIVDLTTDVVRIYRQRNGYEYAFIGQFKVPSVLDMEALPGLFISRVVPGLAVRPIVLLHR